GVEEARGGLAARHLCGDLDRQIGNVERLSFSNPRNSLDQTAPNPLKADPEGCHQPHTGHHDASHILLVTRARRKWRRNAIWSGGVRQRPAQLCVSMKLTASFTVTIFSAASSGISHPNSSSKAITSSTVSRLSAPKSSMKLAFSVTFDSSTPKCSTTIFLTRSATSLIRSVPQWLAGSLCYAQSALASSLIMVPPSGTASNARVTVRSNSMIPRQCQT